MTLFCFEEWYFKILSVPIFKFFHKTQLFSVLLFALLAGYNLFLDPQLLLKSHSPHADLFFYLLHFKVSF